MMTLRPFYNDVKTIRIFLICFCGWLLASCSNSPIEPSRPPLSFSANGFDIAAWENPTTHNSSLLTIFIEGDGRAFNTKGHPSKNPTPRQPIVASLVRQTPHSIGLARPCQYIRNNTKCKDHKYWTTHRFAPEVIASYNAIINQIIAQKNIRQNIRLVGFSGGGAIAALIAAKRDDVASMITLAGNLDIEAVNQYHNVPAMPASLNPINFANKTRHIPQIHYSGTQDKIVPVFIADNFIKHIGKPHQAKHVTLPNRHHASDWVASWHKIIKHP